MLTNELNELIQRNLPELVGKELKQRLEQAEKDARDVATLRAAVQHHENLSQLRRSLEERETKAKARELALATSEQAYAVKAAVLELREKHATERVAEMRGVVGDVFRNNVLKYRQTGVENVPVPGSGQACGYVDQKPINKIVESEG